jgi:hypothetical protein
MRVEEYECHFMKMMRYAPDDLNTEHKKQFWFLRGLHHGLRQGLKASEHKSLLHLVNRVIVVEEEPRGAHEGQEEDGRSRSPRPILPETEERTEQHAEGELPPGAQPAWSQLQRWRT